MCRWSGKTLMNSETDLVIDSDATQIGWSAACQGQKTGGGGSLVQSGEEEPHQLPRAHGSNFCHSNICQEQDRHISSPQNRQHNSGCLHQQTWWNCFKGAYSPGKKPVDVVSGKEHTNQTQQLPGVLNQIANYKSRTMIDCTDLQLNPAIFRQVNQLFNPLEVDLFASRFTTQLQVYFSWRPDPYATATDVFLQDWSLGKGYANPPWCLIGR